MKTMYVFLVWVAGTISLLASPPLLASSDYSPKQIRQWVRSGEILSLDDILQKHRQRFQGRLLDLEVEREHGRIVYELEFLREDGRVVEFEIDAATGELLKQDFD